MTILNPPPLRCLVCKEPCSTEDLGVCIDCRIEERARTPFPGTPSSTLCREGHHDKCNGRWAVHYQCGCRCHKGQKP